MGHSAPHTPQFSGLDTRSTQAVPQAVFPASQASVVPGWQRLATHEYP